jgi:hypothetical protein
MSHDDHKRMKIFSATSGEHLAKAMCKHLELPVASATVERFPDGEIIVKVDEDVRGRDCFIVQSTSMPVNETLMEIAKTKDAYQLRRNSLRISSRQPALIASFAWICTLHKSKASLTYQLITLRQLKSFATTSQQLMTCKVTTW